MSAFLKALHSGRVLLMDGAMGTELQKRGLRSNSNAAAWTLSHPKRVRAVHDAYRRAGAKVMLTNTFTINASSIWYKVHLGELDLLSLWKEACSLVSPPESPVFRIASLGPVAGEITRREFDDFSNFHFFPDWILEGVDAVLLETCSSPRVRLAIQRVQKESTRPLLLSLTYLRNGKGQLVTFSNHSPEWFAERANKWGLAALGVNCGRDIDMDNIIDIIRRYRAVTDLPLFARPNAGTPKRKGKKWIYPHTPKQMAERLPELLEAGVSMVGGCCGTTPKYIAAFREVIDSWNKRIKKSARG